MQIEIISDQPKHDQTFSAYPKLKRSRRSGTIALFSAPGTGMILSTREPGKFGAFATCLDEKNFEPLRPSEEIRLRN